MAAFRINRTNDAVFKAIFAKYPKITLALINAFLEFQGTEQLVDIEFIDREIDSDEYDGKESRLDIRGRTASGTKVNIEMQVNSLAAMGERSLFYWARNYAELKRGEEYDQLKRTIAINILGFNLFSEKQYQNMHSCFGIYDIKTQCQLKDKREINLLELPKFKSKSVKDMNRMEKWAAYFSPATSDEELEEIAAGEEAIKEAMEVEDVFTKDEVAKRSYEKAEKFRRDQAAQLNFARQESRNEERAKAVAMLKRLKLSKDAAIQEIMESYSLPDKEAAALVNSNW